MASGPKPPKVFVSYSHDTEEHKRWALALATRLANNGVDVIFDQWDLGPGHDLTAFMNEAVSTSDRVLLICSEKYVAKVDAGKGGAGYEGMIVHAELLRDARSNKFIPVLRNNPSSRVPVALGTKLYVDLREDSDSVFDTLLRDLHGMPRVARPTIGLPPQPPHSEPADTIAWFDTHRKAAMKGIGERASMELSFYLPSAKVHCKQLRLLEAMQRSEIHTFGWPLGIVGTRSDNQPHVRSDGIQAEIQFDDLYGQNSYDYWALRFDGAFYLRQSLFEDKRDPESIFFNTRIARVAEGFQLARNLYRELEVPDASDVALGVRHDGIRGRRLSSSNPARHLSPFVRKCHEDTAAATTRVAHPARDSDIVIGTKTLLESLFVLFDYFVLSDSIYEDIVLSFLRGEVT
ncbi:MAG TPA: toll/interleukin-1 receptor domain-containing protein [Kofleriaceae bacterium]